MSLSTHAADPLPSPQLCRASAHPHDIHVSASVHLQPRMSIEITMTGYSQQGGSNDLAHVSA